jgi:hypothetical protein
MTVQLAISVVNTMLDAWETAIGVTAIVRLRSGAQPTNCAAADAGTVLATFTLASDWAAAASAGSKVFNGLPLIDASADAAGTLGHYRIYSAAGTVCMEQGSITATGGGGDMTVDNTVVALAQPINITAWTKNMTAHA